jgi:hypothetical protein
MAKFVVALFFCALTLVTGCGHTQTAEPAEGVPSRAMSGAPPEVQAVAEQLLGSDAEVLASGDLAHNGKRQTLLINRIPATRPGDESRILFNRAAILEQHGADWNEVLLCDEYLKNPRGFLAGTPAVSVTAWQLQVVSGASDGSVSELDFTPLRSGDVGSSPTIVVRWNPGSGRYQSFDAATSQFLPEAVVLTPPASELREPRPN